MESPRVKIEQTGSIGPRGNRRLQTEADNPNAGWSLSGGNLKPFVLQNRVAKMENFSTSKQVENFYFKKKISCFLYN